MRMANLIFDAVLDTAYGGLSAAMGALRRSR